MRPTPIQADPRQAGEFLSDSGYRATLADRVRIARTGAKFDRATLARLGGVTPGAVAQWEHPEGTNPTVCNLARVAIALRVEFDWLATGRGRMLIEEQLDFGDPTVGPLSREEQLLVHRWRELASPARAAFERLMESLERAHDAVASGVRRSRPSPPTRAEHASPASRKVEPSENF
jgi:transcriptional regulator with XRE-family HTH domain